MRTSSSLEDVLFVSVNMHRKKLPLHGCWMFSSVGVSPLLLRDKLGYRSGTEYTTSYWWSCIIFRFRSLSVRFYCSHRFWLSIKLYGYPAGFCYLQSADIALCWDSLTNCSVVCIRHVVDILLQASVVSLLLGPQTEVCSFPRTRPQCRADLCTR
jgi:hypothetical protein